jgi:hypothetical protein
LTRLAEEVGDTVTAWAWAYLIFALIALFVGAIVVAAIRNYRLQQHLLHGRESTLCLIATNGEYVVIGPQEDVVFGNHGGFLFL